MEFEDQTWQGDIGGSRALSRMTLRLCSTVFVLRDESPKVAYFALEVSLNMG